MTSRSKEGKELFAYQISTMQISQSTAKILLLPVLENKLPPYLNFTRFFDFDLYAVIGMRLCTGLPNILRSRRSATELWRHISFSNWRPYSCKFTSVFGYGHLSRCCRHRDICRPNFDHTSQLTAEILLRPLRKSKRSPY